MVDPADQKTRFISSPDLFTYQVLFKSVHIYGRYRITKNSIHIYICIYIYITILTVVWGPGDHDRRKYIFFFFQICRSPRQLFIFLLKTRQNITHLAKVHFIKVNELKLAEIEFFQYFFSFMCTIANASEIFSMAHLGSVARLGIFLIHITTTIFQKLNTTF